MALKQKSAEAPADAKKRKIVSFAKTDRGVEANECIKIFLVSSQDEVVSKEGFCIDPIGLNQYFGEAGIIYGYKDLKINIWLSTVSFHAYADISYASTADGGKGITDLKPGLENIFGEALLDKNEFLQTFSTESQCVGNIVSAGTVLGCYSLNEDGDSSDAHLSDQSTVEHQIVRMNLHSLPVGLLYSRLVPLTLLLIDGSSPIDVTDPGWHVYFVVKRVRSHSADCDLRLVGFSLIYRFYHHPDNTRLRLSLILVLPPHQGLGHGRRLLESVNAVAVSENVYDLTMEEPSEYLQYLRSCLDTLRMLDFEPIKPAVNTAASSLMDSVSKKPSKSLADPPAHAVEIARQKLKINKKQFLRCWEILLYLNLDPKNLKSMENFRASIAARAERDVLNNDIGVKGKRLIEVPNDYDHDMTFVVYYPLGEDSDEADGRFDDENGADQRKQLNKMIDKRLEEIAEIAERVSLLRS
ncbi:putative histone acetyltransferase type B catalytic subunit [Platanthera zijinensis]|uniref:histone acetyltransferase n=1 Tax=Platanthera zijinensis TaxID=2320716 RepID=A0AAP0BRZ7_9ASPA